MFWKRGSTKSTDRLRDVFSRPVGSLRTRYSLATAGFLLFGLAFCYVGGRSVLSDLLRDAGEEFRQIGNSLSMVVLRHDESLAGELSSFVESVRAQVEEGHLGLSDIVSRKASEAAEGTVHVSLAVRFSASGLLREGFCRSAGEGFAVSKGEFTPYNDVFIRWRTRLKTHAKTPPIGIIRIRGVPHYVIMTSLRGGGYLLAGRPFEEKSFLEDMRRNLPGMEVKVVKRAVQSILPEVFAGSVPLVRLLDDRHAGDHEADHLSFAMVDVLGSPVSVISVTPPRTFTSVTVMAVGRYSALIALVGILMAVPIFWLQGRLLLDPLSRMTRAITELAAHRADVDCPRLEWPGNDELAQLATAFNRMLETISVRAVSVANLEQSHRALINGLPDAIVVFDARGRLVSISKEADGVDPLPGFVVGDTPDGAVFGYPEVDRFVTVVADTANSGRAGQARLKVQRPKGMPKEMPTRHFEIRLTRMDEHFVMAIVRDVTKEVSEHKLRLSAERKVLDARKRESLTSLAAGIAHDMNNVLSVVLNAAEAEGADPSGDSVKTLGTIREAVRRGTSMMRELQAFAGESRMEFMRASPKLLVGDVLQLVSRVVGPNIVLTCDVAPGVPDVDVDVNQFWKILFNIVKNASEAIGSRLGKIEIAVRPYVMTELTVGEFYCEHSLAPGPGVLFRVTDDGDGIPPDMLERLFDPYVSSKALGRGLGLATVRTIVEAHGGGIKVKCPPQGGTIFGIYLPASRIEPTVPDIEAAPAAAAAPAATGGDVLVVDNDKSLLKMTSILLKTMHFTPHLAQDRREALAVVRRHAHELKAILLDAHIGGIDTVRLLGAFRIGAPGVPVLVVSGSAEDEIRKLFAPHPYDAFLAKPYTIGELKRAIFSARPLDA